MSTTLKQNARKHSRISPSGLKPLKVCPGYENEDFGSKDAADRGTFLHEIMETGKIPPQPWPPYMRPGDEEIAKSVLAITQEADARSEYDPIVEVELDFTSLKLKNFEKGHADRVIVLETSDDGEPTHVEMIDYKFGKWAVEDVGDNIQFRAYAMGLFLMWPSLARATVRIIQPELGLDESHTFTRAKDFDMMTAQVGAIVKRRHKFLETKDEAMLNTDPDNCSFCGVQATCPIWQKYQVKLANESNVLETTVMPIEMLENPEEADPEEVVRIFRWIKPMEDYLRKVKRFALAVYDTGRMSQGLQLVEKQGDASITDILFVRDHLEKNYGVSHDEFMTACDISLGRVKELVGSRAKSGQKEATMKQVITELSDEGIISYGNPVRYLMLQRGKKK